MSRDNEVVAHLRVAIDEVDFVTVEAGRESQFAYLSLVPGEISVLPAAHGRRCGLSRRRGRGCGQDWLRAGLVGARVPECRDGTASGWHARGGLSPVHRAAGASGFPPCTVRRDASVALFTDRGGEFNVYDISTSGIGFVADPQDAKQVTTDGVRGVLKLGEDCKVNVWLDVRHTRALGTTGKDDRWRRFLGLSSRELATLQTFMDERSSKR